MVSLLDPTTENVMELSDMRFRPDAYTRPQKINR